MRHRNRTFKLGRTTSHRDSMFANMVIDLITHESIQTTLPKAKALRSYAEKVITLAKKNTLASRRQAIAKLKVRFNALTPKEQKAARSGDTSAYNNDRLVIEKLFTTLAKRFEKRQGGYTRIVKQGFRVGDNAQMCRIEYLAE